MCACAGAVCVSVVFAGSSLLKRFGFFLGDVRNICIRPVDALTYQSLSLSVSRSVSLSLALVSLVYWFADETCQPIR